MAVRVDAAADRLLRTTDLINFNAAYTVMFWAYPVTLTQGFAYLWTINRDQGNETAQDYLHLGNGGTAFNLGSDAGGGNYTEVVGATLSVSTWYHVAIVRASATQSLLYVNGVLGGTNNHTTVAGRSAATRFEFGAYGSGNTTPFNGRYAYLKAWSTNLSLEQIQSEMNLIQPVFATSLYGFWPAFPGATERLADYSGNGRNWTAGGTLTDEDAPPVSWGAPVWPVGIAVAGGGEDTQAVSPDLVASTATVYSPTVTVGGVTVVPNFLASAAAVYSPTITTGAVTVAPNLVASTAQVFAPTVTSVVTIEVELVESTAQVFEPAITVGAVTIAPNLVTSAAVVHAPAVTVGAVVVAPDFIASTATVYSPAVSVEGGTQTVAPAAIASTALVHAPAVVVGAVTVAPNAIESAAQVYVPTVASVVTLTPSLVASAAQVFAPAVLPGVVEVIVAFIASTAVMYAPFVDGGSETDAKLDVMISDRALYVIALAHSDRALYRIALAHRAVHSVMVSDSTR